MTGGRSMYQHSGSGPGYTAGAWVPIFTVALCLAVATAMVGLRTWSRIFITKRLGVDDWAAIITLIPTFACGITIALSTKSGLGRSYLDIVDIIYGGYFKYYWFSMLFYRIGLFAVKVTLLLQYFRFLGSPLMNFVCAATIFVVGGWCLSQVIVTALLCQPIQAVWDPQVPATCIAPLNHEYVNVVGNIITDVTVLVLAIPVIKRPGLPRLQKHLMAGVLTLGLFTVVISFIKIKYIGVEYYDDTWNDVAVWGWSIGQLTLGLTCACLPTIRPLLAKFIPSLENVSKSDNTVGRAEMGGDNDEHDGRKGWFRPRDAHGAYLSEADGGIGTMVYEKGDSDEARQLSHDAPVPRRKTETTTDTHVASQEMGPGWERYEMPA